MDKSESSIGKDSKRASQIQEAQTVAPSKKERDRENNKYKAILLVQ